MEAAPYILQIALFGAAGTSFVLAHLKNRAADERSGDSPTQRWRLFRHPHQRATETKVQRLLRRAAALQTAWGFCFLGGAMVAPVVFGWLNIGA